MSLTCEIGQRTENIRPWMKGEIEMKAIEFVMNYESYVKEIEAVVRSEFKPIIQKMLEIDPHDLITPDSYFEGESVSELLLLSYASSQCHLEREPRTGQTRLVDDKPGPIGPIAWQFD